MISKEAIEKKIKELEILATEIENGMIKLIQGAPLFYQNITPSPKIPPYYWGLLPIDLMALQREITWKYQHWYSSAYQLIKEYLPDRIEEFKRHYEDPQAKNGVIEYIQLRWRSYYDKPVIEKGFIEKFDNQRSILLSIRAVLEINDLCLRKTISADFIDSELVQADYLFRNGFERAAGAIAGVALEKYLKTECELNRVPYKYKDTIEPLAQALHSAGKISDTDLKRIIYLGGIRNDCAHPNEVSKDLVKALIEQVRKVVNQ
ncbi:MAG: hypothetical protein WAW52_14930 [Methanothrix sp.]